MFTPINSYTNARSSRLQEAKTQAQNTTDQDSDKENTPPIRPKVERSEMLSDDHIFDEYVKSFGCSSVSNDIIIDSASEYDDQHW